MGSAVVLRNQATWPGFFVNLGLAGAYLSFAGLWAGPYLTTVHGMTSTRASAHTTVMLVAFALSSLAVGGSPTGFGRRRAPAVALGLVHVGMLAPARRRRAAASRGELPAVRDHGRVGARVHPELGERQGGEALRSLEQKGSQLDFSPVPEWEVPELIEKAKRPSTERLHQVQRALLGGATLEQLFEATKIDPWYLDQLQLLNEISQEIRHSTALTQEMLQRAKRHGFSDAQIGALTHNSEDVVRGVRQALGIRPVYKTVDTCAAEFAAYTPYHYSSYDEEDEVALHAKPSIIILGSGPNRIGQGIEFDYSCVHASMALRKAGYETVMVNCNPETVSTDYDVSTRLYFEPLTLEDVLEVIAAEERTGGVMGVFVQLGGQTPLKLAQQLADAGVPILGTSPEAIDLAEHRGAFSRVLDEAGLISPKNGTAVSFEDAKKIADEIGYPVLVRPSYVLGGRGMEIVYDEAEPLPLHRQRHRNHPGPPGADRPLPRGRRRDRRRRPLRRQGHVPRRHHGTHRGSRHPLRRLRLRAAPDHPGQQRDRPRPDRHAGHRRRRRRPRPDQHPVRPRLRRALRARGQPARLPHRARSSPRRPACRWPRRQH